MRSQIYDIKRNYANILNKNNLTPKILFFSKAINSIGIRRNELKFALLSL